MGIVLGATAFCWGLIFIFGPSILRIILEVVSRPVSEYTLYCGVAYIMFMIITRIVCEAIDGNEKMKVCKKTGKVVTILKKMLSVLYILGMLSVALLVLKPVTTTFSEFLNGIMIKYADKLHSVRHIGMLLIVISSIFFLISYFNQKHTQVEEVIEPEEETLKK